MSSKRTSPSDAYLTPYREAHSEHGPGFGVTLWASRKSQRLRFKVFTEMIDFKATCLLDAGCSRGDFAAYLLDHNIDFAHYIGVDGLCQVIEHARQRRLPRTEFICGDFITEPALFSHRQPQVIAISGSLNTMDDSHVLSTLDAAWSRCGQALIFNFLSDRTGPGAKPQQYPARRLSTTVLLDWAMDQTWSVQFRQDYFAHGHDATILMKKDS